MLYLMLLYRNIRLQSSYKRSPAAPVGCSVLPSRRLSFSLCFLIGRALYTSCADMYVCMYVLTLLSLCFGRCSVFGEAIGAVRGRRGSLPQDGRVPLYRLQVLARRGRGSADVAEGGWVGG